jgi:type I restriction enzyme M protein
MKIVSAYAERQNTVYFTKLVPNAHTAAQDHNLSVSTYVKQEDKREVADITALNAEIERIVACEDVLRREIAAIVGRLKEAYRYGNWRGNNPSAGRKRLGEIYR